MEVTKKEKDFFAGLASGGKKMDGEVKRLAEIEPKKLKRKKLKKAAKQQIVAPTFDEQKAYESFLNEKERLKKRYLPFLKNHATPIKRNERELKEFLFRKETEADKADFEGVLSGKGSWERVVLPHYDGPAGEWNAFYKTELTIEKKEEGKRYLLFFEAVDYIAEVYLNGRLITRHEGFFAPFTSDITEFVKESVNSLLIVVKNQMITSGCVENGFTHYGDKIYGHTHLGYDEPNLGWHHCPSGAGIIGKVKLLVSPMQRITDIFVRPNLDEKTIKVRTTVENFEKKPVKCTIRYRLEGRNFDDGILLETVKEYAVLQYGKNYIEDTFEMRSFKTWCLENPYLYEITSSLLGEDGEVVFAEQTHFGMRKFSMDENSKPKGAFYFNNKRIMLRGTNEMGHLCRCLMNGNTEQLIDDILTAKVANLNFYRMTQRPVFDEIYTYFDMLGMLCQSDFPLFSYMPPSALGEALKQVDEMERLTRNHPCVVVESLCNETLDKTAWGKEQYVLSRFEMEKFFHAAKQVIEIENPDRVLKFSEGDYAPLADGYGVSDFHCYTFWYVSHGMPSGKLRKGYLPPIPPEWMTGCGEFGTEGLDRFELMKKYCPKEWLPESADEEWNPSSIAKAQCFALHGDFYPEQKTAGEWIEKSRVWQRVALKEYVHILRLRSDYIQSTTVHLLIDAWPCGWMKTLVDVDRIPKPAYYALKEAMLPTRISLRRDQYTVYASEELVTEAYAFNDLPQNVPVSVTASVYYGDSLKETVSVSANATAVSTTYCGEIRLRVPKNYVGKVRVVARMDDGKRMTFDEVEFVVKQPLVKAKKRPILLGENVKCVKAICKGEVDENVIFIDQNAFLEKGDKIEKLIESGKKAVLFIDRPLTVFGTDIIFRIHTLEEEVRANNYVATSETGVYTKEFADGEFMNFYNRKKGYQDLTAWFKFDWDGSEEILYTFESNDKNPTPFKKHRKMIMAEKSFGKGKLILTTLSALDGCVGENPVLDKLLINLIEK